MDAERWRERKYVPEWHGNRGDPEPVVVVYRTLSVGERESLIAAETEPDGAGIEALRAREATSRDLLRGAVVRVDGLTSGGEPMTFPAALEWIAGQPLLLLELRSAIVRESSVEADQGKGSA